MIVIVQKQSEYVRLPPCNDEPREITQRGSRNLARARDNSLPEGPQHIASLQCGSLWDGG